MPSLTTVARVKGALGIPTAVTIRDVRLAEIIEEVEDSLLSETTLSAWLATTYSETPRTYGNHITRVARFPLLSVVAITMLGGSVPASDYSFTRSGAIRLLGYGAAFPSSLYETAITYTAGAIAVAGSTPAALIRAGTLAATRQANLEGMSGLALSSIQPLSHAAATPNNDLVMHEIARIMAQYRAT